MQTPERKCLSGSSWIQLLPFLLVYMAISLGFQRAEFSGDEERYLQFARNLLEGFYSPPPPDIDLWNGPGYPLFLAPFVVLDLPLAAMRMANAVLLYLSLVVCHRTVMCFAPRSVALTATVALGCYYPVFENLPFLLTEILAWFLVSTVCYLVLRSGRDNGSWCSVVPAGFALALLALTKAIIGYVLPAMLVGALVMWFFHPFRPAGRLCFRLAVVALMFCLPYLVYTHQLTGRPFYWASCGGKVLYNMSTPVPDEWGEWRSDFDLANDPDHSDFYNKALQLPPLERDDACRAAALENIRNHPAKFVKNWAANMGRMLFSYPFSNTPQSLTTFFTLVPNLFVLPLLFLAGLAALLRWRQLPPALIVLWFVMETYLAGSSLVCAYRRMFYITLPFWAVFAAFVFHRLVEVRFRAAGPARNEDGV